MTQQVLNRFSEAIQQSKVDVVPRVVVGASKDGGSGNIMEALLTMLLSDRFGALANEAQGERSEEAEQASSGNPKKYDRKRIRKSKSTNGQVPNRYTGRHVCSDLIYLLYLFT